jgi:hypothetical protein
VWFTTGDCPLFKLRKKSFFRKVKRFLESKSFGIIIPFNAHNAMPELKKYFSEVHCSAYIIGRAYIFWPEGLKRSADIFYDISKSGSVNLGCTL